ncbi:LacI family DNA-binding transcriptional regulator [Aristaeella hokkaidonensis]|uniref:LacI family DNA-binding transcriptional regulator n=1 Tax=Aristaeella hokkaidonensis TaxID=3046382 RepID=A0AC61N1E5_9FIRM|nr:LacI family DNA-binding transcriptional regulator [Aristaeella hokkaidonensis]QUC67034.1 LacI family DNA-binding transcriptional regulator [Aristaeella hokkaidonensis]SNT93655.1 transcriptional regulator, LacI family [Aristaeella hokkaidonensis]
MAVNRITLRDVAGACGYTVNTVSRALRGDPRLPESTREKIRAAAVQMGYIRNSLASTLRSGRSGNIAVIVNDVHNLHFCNMLTVMDSELRQAGYNIMVLCMGLNEELGEHLIRSAISQSVDGILYFPYMNNRSHIEIMQKNNMPFVLLDRRIQDIVTDNVRCDDRQGGFLAGVHLAGLGHKKYLFMSGENRSSSQIDRLEGFMQAMREYGIPESNIRVVPGEKVEAALADSTLRELLFPLDYTALVSFRDEVSYPVMLELADMGLEIPKDISIVSFDHLRGDIPYLPKLTSIFSEGQSVASNGVRLLLNRIEHPDLPPQVIVLPVRLFDEGTAAPPVK